MSQSFQCPATDANAPLVSVIIPCFNYGAYLPAAIDSVLSSTYANVEILVVDDGSTDAGTLEVLDHLVRPRTRVIRQENKRLPGARNTGIREARGKYILPLDADDVVRPTYIEKAVWILETYPDVGIVTPSMRLFGDENATWGPPAFNMAHLLFANMLLVASMFRREAWEQVGGYDEGMVHGYEDWEFWIHLTKHGWKAHRLWEPLFLYRRHGTTMIHAAMEKHDLLVRQIRDRHPELYTRKNVQALLKEWGPPPFPLPPEFEGTFLRFKRHCKAGLRQAIPSRLLGALTTRYRRTRHQLNERVKRLRGVSSLPHTPPAHPAAAPLSGLRLPALHYPVTEAASGSRVLLVIPDLSVTGGGRLFLELARSLASLGKAVTIATTGPSEADWWEPFDGVAADIVSLATFASEIDAQQAVLELLLRTRSFELVLLNAGPQELALVPFLKDRLPEAACVSLVHGDHVSWEQLGRGLQQASPALACHAIVLPELARSLTARFGIPAAQQVLLPFAVDPSSGLASNHLPPFPLPAWPQDKQIVLYIGKFDEACGAFRAVEIASNLVQGDYYRDLHFVMLGEGPERPALEALIQAKGLEERFTLVTHWSALSALLASAAVLVSPSRYEGLPWVGLEAMARGVPVVAARVVGWQDLVTDGHDGYLVDIYDPVAFAERIATLLHDERLRATLGSQARASAGRRSVPDFSDALESLCRQVAADSPERARQDTLYSRGER